MQAVVCLLIGLSVAQTQPIPESVPGVPGVPAPAPAASCQTQGYSYELQGNYTGVDPWSCPEVSDDCWMTGGASTPFVSQKMCCCRTTGDFYPHYPYPAPYFGYYYFRPYNWVHVAEHQATAVKWGLDPRIPYSHELFYRLYAALPVEPPSKFNPRQAGSLPRSRRLPNLEDLLDKQPEGEYDPIPVSQPVSQPVAPPPAPEPGPVDPATPAPTN